MHILFKLRTKMKKNEIKILTDKEHILLNSDMYVGSLAMEEKEILSHGKFIKKKIVPALQKIGDEIIDNSVDEAIRTGFKFANVIEVTITGAEMTVQDNGRGLPQTPVLTPEGEEIPGPVAAWTRARTGGNFEKGRTTIGKNGVGSALTNFFSDKFVGETCDGKNTVQVFCTNNADNISHKIKKGGKQGTKVSFMPDFEKFGVMRFDDEIIEVFESRLQTLAVAFPEITFKFNGKKISNNVKNFVKEFGETIEHKNDNSLIFFACGEDGLKNVSFVNGVHTKNGGSHVEDLVNAVTDELIPMIKRQHKVEINRARIREMLTVGVFLRNFEDSKFDSQTKDRLTSTWGQVKAHIDLDITKFARKFLKCEALIMPIIEAALIRKEAADKAAATKAQKKAKQAKVAKHIKANLVDDPKRTRKTTLFLTEGDSALGYLAKVGDPDIHGGFPLRGKVKNIWDESDVDVLANKELFEIMAILDLQIGKKPSFAYYDYIGIMTDADHDGVGSIYPLLLAFFFKYWPSLFEEERVMFVKTPVIIIQDPKDLSKNKWYYSIPDFEKEKEKLPKGWEVRYIKGLGSLEESEYSRVINDPVLDVVKMDDNAKELFEILYGDEPQLRKDWLSVDVK